MFGRSGQMFPRQRAYHDAMYEDHEYNGSEEEDDCCRGRGVASVLCWFLSVILLIGLAASVILTVFFVLKSRNSIGSSTERSGGGNDGGIFEDLDLFYGFNQNSENKSEMVLSSTHPPMTTTTEMTLDIPDEDFTLFKESQTIQNVLPDKVISTSTTTTTTNLPQISPTRRRTYDFTVMSHTSSTTPPPVLSTSRTTKVTETTTVRTTTTSAVPYVVGDMDSIMATINPPPNFPRRISNLATLDYPSILQKSDPPRRPEVGSDERWLPIHSVNPSSSSEENLSTTTNAHVLFSMPPSVQDGSHNPSLRRRFNRGPLPTSFSTSTEKQTGDVEFPKPKQMPDPTTTTTTATTMPSIPTTADSRGNLLERIIKNLAPKFKNSTEIISSSEKLVPLNPNLRVKTTIRTRTTSLESILNPGVNNSEVSESVVNVTTPLPSLPSSPTSSPNFMDILVRDDDQKRLVTKETESGLITSAILPAWYVNDTTENIGEMTRLHVVNVTMATIPEEYPPTTIASGTIQPEQYAGLGQFFMNMFGPSTSTPGHADDPDRLGSLELEPTFHSTSFKDLLRGVPPVLPSSSLPPLLQDGYIYSDEEASDGSEDISSGDNDFPGASHVIEVAFDQKASPESVTNSKGNSAHERYFEFRNPADRQPLISASEVHSKIIPPPEDPIKSRIPPNATASAETSEISSGTTGDSVDSTKVEGSNRQPSSSLQQLAHLPGRDLTGSSKKFQNEKENDRDLDNFFVERQPVNQLDENLYLPIPASTPLQKRQQVSSEKKFPSSSEEHHLQGALSALVEVPGPNSLSTNGNNATGFNPPVPIDFHSNVYNFNPTSSGGFTPLIEDNWRPVVYDDKSIGQKSSHRLTSPQPPVKSGSVLPTFKEALKLRQTTTVSPVDQSGEPQSYWPVELTNPRATKSPRIVPSQPIMAPPAPPPMSSGRIKFPTGEDQAMSAGMNGQMIDRSKYLQRPVPPPVLMRRNPMQGLMPMPNRRQSLINQQNFYQHQVIQQQRLLKERLFQHHLPRQRPREGGGQVHWPNEDLNRRN